jgi:hypothetical protein
MNRIILDQIRRWRVVMILIGAVYFLFAGFIEREGGSEMLAAPFNALLNHVVFYVYTFQIIIVCLGIFLTMELQRGLARVLTTLPVTTKKIGRALWLASVAIPAVGLTVIGFLALLVFSIGANRAMPLGSYLVACVLAAPTLGAMFGAMTFTRTAIPDTFIDRIGTMFSNLFLMLPIFGLLFFDKTNPNLPVAGLIFAALTILTIIGWFRAEQLVLNRAGFRLASRHPRKQTGQNKTPAGFGGIPFLIIKTTSQVFLMYLIIVVVMLGVTMLFSRHRSLQNAVESTAGGYNLVLFSAWAVGIFQVLHIFTQLRLLRTLPISTTKLAALLVFLPTASLALMSLILGTFLYAFIGQAEAFEVAAIFLIPITIADLAIPLVLWSGWERNSLALIGFVFFLSLTLPIFFGLDQVPLSFRCAVAIIIVSISFIATKYLLPRSNKAYRLQLSNLGAWGMGGR